MARPLLLRLPNWLGDLIQAWPVVRATAEDARRPAIFVGPAAFEGLLRPRFPSALYIPWSRARRFAAVPEIRRLEAGLALLLTDSLSSALLAALAGVPERVGYAAEFRSLLLTRRVPRAAPSRSRPRLEEYAALARAAGLTVEDEIPRLTATDEERERASALLESRGLRGAYVVLAPGASYGPAKRWDAERFAALGAALRGRDGTRSVLVGAREDGEATGRVVALLGPAALDLTGSTDLPALAGVLDGAALVASNDSGVMHLAAALGRPTVAIFGSTSPIWSAAQAPWVRALYAAYPCSPCFRRTCPIGYGCLRSIEVSAATGAAEELLATYRAVFR